MTRLSPEAQELLESGQVGLTPSVQAKEKIFGAIEQSIASGAGASTGAGLAKAVSTNAVAKSAITTKLALAFVMASGLGAAAFFYTSNTKSNQAANVSSSSDIIAKPPIHPEPLPSVIKDIVKLKSDKSLPMGTSPITAKPDNSPDMLDPVETKTSPVTKTKKNKRAKRLNTQDLSKESKLIAAAQQAIHQKKYAQAHALLQKHKRKYANGILAPERDAAMAITLCLQEKLESGQRKARQFLKTHPRSPLGPRLRQNCKL